MSNDDDFWAEKTGELIGMGAAGVALVLAPHAAATQLAALAPPAGAIAVRSLARRWGRAWAGFRSAENATEEHARERFAAYRESEAVQDAVLETFRRMEAALDPDVVFALGRLLWPYTDKGRKPDRFFRSMGRLLVDLESRELKDIATMLRGGVASARRRSTRTLNLSADMKHPSGTRGVGIIDDTTATHPEIVLESNGAIALFALPKTQRFGIDENRWGMSPAESIEMDVDVAEQILAVIDF